MPRKRRRQSGRIGAAAGPARPGQSRRARCRWSSPRSTPKPMPIMIEAVGTVQAIASIQIKPRLDSQIMKVHVEEGALVKEGDLLFELDAAHAEGAARPDRGADPQGPGADRAGQARLRARRGPARPRAPAPWSARHRATALKAAEAQLEADEAPSARTSLTQLTYTEIRAPVSGRIGSIPSKAGAIVRIGDNTATACSPPSTRSTRSIVAFAIPQVYPARPARGHGQGRRSRSTRSIDDDSKQSGEIAFIENTVDPTTGTVMAKARIANANEGLWPGQFVRPRSCSASSRRRCPCRRRPCSSARRAPTSSSSRTASRRGPRRSSIKRTQQRRVGGRQRASKAGEQVVIDGQLRLVNGAAVAVQPATDPSRARQPATPPRG